MSSRMSPDSVLSCNVSTLDVGTSTSSVPKVAAAQPHVTPRFSEKTNTLKIRTSQFIKLKSLADEAIRNQKIFAIYGDNEPVRKALIERGWIEKISPIRINTTKIDKDIRNKKELQSFFRAVILSNLIINAKPNFIWNSKDDWDIAKIYCIHTIIYNRLPISHLWATKIGLCRAVSNQRWSYIEDVAEVNSPRTYTFISKADHTNFRRDFHLTACTSLLKWLLSMVENERIVFHESGTVTINVIVFAINRCKEYLFRKQNKDIDKAHYTRTSNGQWKAFLKDYQILISRRDVFKPDKEKKVPLFLGYAKILLKEIHKYRPQLSCEGCHNIWIVKPANCSRGRGIRMESKLRALTGLLNQGNYLFQKYIEEPLLLYETKFDIRQYFLVSNTFPLEIWMYRDSYLKFSSNKYSVKSYHESIHLTNNAVQKKYTKLENRNPELPYYNMWSSDTFKDYLKDIDKDDVWDTVTYPGMRKAIVGIITSCQNSITDCKKRFELFGCDFILDKGYKPWLIEINSCPDLSPTTPVTSVTCRAVLSDVIKVIIDRAADPKAPIGNFECIYRQTLSLPICDTEANLKVRGFALPNEYFYKGNIQKVESVSDESIGKPPDIAAMLQKLKTSYYETDIMQEPEDNNHLLNPLLRDNVSDEGSSTDDEVHETAVIIMKQVESLIGRIPLEDRYSLTSFDPSTRRTDVNETSAPSASVGSSNDRSIDTSSFDKPDTSTSSDTSTIFSSFDKKKILSNTQNNSMRKKNNENNSIRKSLRKSQLKLEENCLKTWENLVSILNEGEQE